jgi:hypothetical protein
VLLVGSALLVGLVQPTVAPAPAQAASAGWPLILGDDPASLADLKADEALLGRQMGGVRIFRRWGEPLFGNDERAMRDSGHIIFISVKSMHANGSKVMFADIAAAKPGSQLYSDVVSMAGQVKAFGARVMFIFAHEPDASGGRGSGDGPQFIAAWRAIHAIFAAQGLTRLNVRFVATFTGIIFTRASPLNISDYYPGDDFVDAVAMDPYNWASCRGDSWKQLASLIDAQRMWGLSHPTKQLMLMEFGTPEDTTTPGRKAQWFASVESLFKQPAYQQYTALLYFTGRAVAGGCPWDFRSSATSIAAYRALTNDPAFTATA